MFLSCLGGWEQAAPPPQNPVFSIVEEDDVFGSKRVRVLVTCDTPFMYCTIKGLTAEDGTTIFEEGLLSGDEVVKEVESEGFLEISLPHGKTLVLYAEVTFPDDGKVLYSNHIDFAIPAVEVEISDQEFDTDTQKFSCTYKINSPLQGFKGLRLMLYADDQPVSSSVPYDSTLTNYYSSAFSEKLNAYTPGGTKYSLEFTLFGDSGIPFFGKAFILEVDGPVTK